ncbi:hypothetical protein AAFF_G00440000 [Aldrovandia affinis]|uniref:Uncharacterized protein n=1 Tax=Aldrovandia affinis TaxID=143900 RepID=A0AAD7R3C8_9TELE|nr:hypothetical protein AAFF_G00440000 [Aldrovandia affinis]
MLGPSSCPCGGGCAGLGGPGCSDGGDGKPVYIWKTVCSQRKEAGDPSRASITDNTNKLSHSRDSVGFNLTTVFS